MDDEMTATATADQTRRGLETLAETLWAERHVVELLLYRLVAARMFLAADERRFVALALDEVERAVQLLRQAEERRAVAVSEVAATLRVRADDLTLAELALHAPEPLGAVFRDHQEGFRALTSEIEETAALNRRLATAALGHVRQSLDALTGSAPVATYTAAGRQAAATPNPVRLNQVL